MTERKGEVDKWQYVHLLEEPNWLTGVASLPGVSEYRYFNLNITTIS
jgi:hypothetical protein